MDHDARVGSPTSYIEAIRDAQFEEMRRDESVIIIGEDLRSNVFGTARGLYDEFGPERVLDAPVSENAIVGCAVGAAMTGLRPIVDLAMSGFVYCAMDALVSQAAKNEYMFGGQFTVPVLYRMGMLYNGSNAAQHSDRPYPLFMNVPGLTVIAPTSPVDAKGLLKSAIRLDGPVVCFEDRACWRMRETVPEGDVTVPLGQARMMREGRDVTVVAIAGAVVHALQAADTLANAGISVEVIDPRTLVPLDTETIVRSVEKTHRVIVADPAHRTCSAASEIAAMVAEEAFGSLRAPIVRVTSPNSHPGYSPSLEQGFYPDAGNIAAAVHRLLGSQSEPSNVSR